jgi:hypothetical protein
VEPLPRWLTITVVLVVLGLMSYSVLVLGAEGYPTTVALAAIIGAYAGVRELVNRKRNGGE